MNEKRHPLGAELDGVEFCVGGELPAILFERALLIAA